MTDVPVPPALLSAVQRDLRPVRPLASPARRALAMLPLGLVLLVGLPAFWIWLRDGGPLAPWPWRLGSPLETAAGLAILAAAFREAIPGRELTTKALAAAFVLAAVGFVALNFASALPVPPGVGPETVAQWMRDCIRMAATFSVPALAIPAWLVARGLPARPALTGALCGLGTGLMADAGLRMLCWNGERLHVLLAHGGAIVLLMLVAALGAVLIERLKARRRPDLLTS